MTGFTPQQVRFFERVEERARRTELLAATLASGGLSRERAARVLGVEMADLVAEARAVGLEPLSAIGQAVRGIVLHLGGAEDDGDAIARDILVVDDSEVTRDLIALAIEAQGHSVRFASSLAELHTRFRERKPDLILTDSRVEGAPEDRLCAYLRTVIEAASIPIVMFASASGPELEALARKAGAERYLSKDQGIDSLVEALEALFEEIVW